MGLRLDLTSVLNKSLRQLSQRSLTIGIRAEDFAIADPAVAWIAGDVGSSRTLVLTAIFGLNATQSSWSSGLAERKTFSAVIGSASTSGSIECISLPTANAMNSNESFNTIRRNAPAGATVAFEF